jgi:hypothetical protein
MATTIGNRYKYYLASLVSGHTFKIILMKSGFVFDPDTHHGYADVSASELSTANGYTAGGITLTGLVVTENDTADYTEFVWTNPTVTASNGSIGPMSGAIIFDDTPTTPTADPILQYIDFGGDQTQADGGTATISNVKTRIA